MRAICLFTLAALIFGALIATPDALAQPPVNRSLGNGRWDDPNNWSQRRVPNEDDHVIIGAGHTVTINDDKIKAVGSLDVAAGATVLGAGPAGRVSLHAKGDVDNNGTIQGRDGAAGQGNEPGQYGGRCAVACMGTLTNSGVIRGGYGGDGGSNSNGGDGGNLYLRGGTVIQKGQAGGGRGGFRGNSSRRNGTTGHVTVKATEGDIEIRGAGARMTGYWISLQAEYGAVKLLDLVERAIQASYHLIIRTGHGGLDISGYGPTATGPIAEGGTRGVDVRTNKVKEGTSLPINRFFSPPLRVERRVSVQGGSLPPSIGRTYTQTVVAPDDGGSSYQCATALSADTGILLPGYGEISIDPDPLFYLSLFGFPPFFDYAGRLGMTGQARVAMLIPMLPQLVGIDLYTTCVVFEPTALRDFAPAAKATIQK